MVAGSSLDTWCGSPLCRGQLSCCPESPFSLSAIILSAASPPLLLSRTVFLSHHFLIHSLLPAIHLSGSEKQDLHPSIACSLMIEAAFGSYRVCGIGSLFHPGLHPSRSTGACGCLLPSAVGITGVGDSGGPAQLEQALATAAGLLSQVHHTTRQG